LQNNKKNYTWKYEKQKADKIRKQLNQKMNEKKEKKKKSLGPGPLEKEKSPCCGSW
jgi:hypothetical protein